MTEIDPGRNFEEGTLRWPLPSILRDIEIEGGTALVRDLIEAFESDGHQRIRLALDAADDSDRRSLRDQCCRLNASSRQLGATILAEMFEQIERGGEVMTGSELAAILKAASSEFLLLCRRMKSYPGHDYRLPHSESLSSANGLSKSL